MAKKENLQGYNKYSKGRFLGLGKLIEVCLGDFYIVKLDSSRLVKKKCYILL
jgi:hypothetical protein